MIDVWPWYGPIIFNATFASVNGGMTSDSRSAIGVSCFVNNVVIAVWPLKEIVLFGISICAAFSRKKLNASKTFRYRSRTTKNYVRKRDICDAYR